MRVRGQEFYGKFFWRDLSTGGMGGEGGSEGPAPRAPREIFPNKGRALLPGPGATLPADAQNAARNRQRVAIELQARVVGAVAVGRIDPAPILTHRPEPYDMALFTFTELNPEDNGYPLT